MATAPAVSTPLDAFIAHCKEKGLAIGFLSPASSFIGSYLAEALLTQNVAVLGETSENSLVMENFAYLAKNKNLFLAQQSSWVTHDGLKYILDRAAPKYFIIDLDEAISEFLALPKTKESLSERIKLLLNYAQHHKAQVLFFAKMVDEADPFTDPLPAPGKGEKKRTEIKKHLFTLIAEAVKEHDITITTITYTETFGPKMDLDAPTDLTALIASAVNQKSLVIDGDGLIPIRPIYITDFIYGIIKALFTAKASGKHYTLVQPHELTMLTFAKELQQAALTFNIPLEITFSHENKAPDYSQRAIFTGQTIDELGWRPTVSLQDGLVKTLRSFMDQIPVMKKAPTPPEPMRLPEVEIQKTTKRRTLIEKLRRKPNVTESVSTFLTSPTEHQPHGFFKKVGFTLVVVLLTISVLSIIAPSLLYSLQVKSLAANKYIVAQEPAVADGERMLESIDQTEKLLITQEWLYFLFHKQTIYDQKIASLEVLRQTVTAKIAYQRVSDSFNTILHESNQSYSQLSENLLLESRIGQHNSELATLAFAKMPPKDPLRDIVSSLIPQFSKHTNTTDQAQQALTLLDVLFRSQKERTFVLLVADNNQPRSGGGVIVTAGFLSIQPGKAPTYQSLALASPQLKLNLPLPIQLKNATGSSQTTLPFSDSLWEPRQATNLSSYYPILGKIAQKQIAGIVVIDLTGIKNLLTITGPITIEPIAGLITDPSTFTTDNASTKLLENYSNPGLKTTTAQEQFMTAYVQAVVTKLQATQISFQALIDTMTSLNQSQHFAVYTEDQDLQRLALQQHWDEHFAPRGSDFLSVLENNIGSNQTNAYMKKDIRHEVVINDKDDIAERVTATLTNQSPSNAYPFGAYRSYIRILVPSNRRLIRVMLDGKKIADKEITQVILGAEQTVGTIVTVPTGKTVVLTFEYQRLQPLSFTNGASTLSLYIQKQYGVEALGYELIVRYPPTITTVTTEPKFSQLSDGLHSKSPLEHSEIFSLKFKK